MNDFLFTPVFKWPLLMLLAVAAIVVIGWSLWRKLRATQAALLGGFRLLALLALVFMLIQPQKRFDEVTILKPQLAVVIDTSESMTDPVDEGQSRRAARVKDWLAAPALARARENFDVRLFTFDGQLNELGSTA